MSNTNITEMGLRDAIIMRLMKLNVDLVSEPLIEIAGRLGATCVVVAKYAGLDKKDVIALLSECWDRTEQIEHEIGIHHESSIAKEK